MSPQRSRAHRNFRFVAALALVCSGLIALAVSNKVLTASADKGRNESGAPGALATPSAAPARLSGVMSFVRIPLTISPAPITPSILAAAWK